MIRLGMLVLAATVGVLASPRRSRRSRVAPTPPRRRRRRTSTTAVAALAALIATIVLPVGVTYAAFSDFAIVEDNRAGAGTLVIGGDDLVDLTLPTRGASDDGKLQVTNTGDLPAELAVTMISADARGNLCADFPQRPDLAGQLSLAVDGTDRGDLCGAADQAYGLGVLAPGETREVTIEAGLTADAMFHWSGRSATYDLLVTGEQPGGGFSDFTYAALRVTVGDHLPTTSVPAVCAEQGFDLRTARIVVARTSGNNTIDLSGQTGPALVVVDNGNNRITGTAQGDCISVRNGNNRVDGGAGDDVILSRNGNNDEIAGGAGDDHIVAGNGNVRLSGGDGDDHLEAGNGNVHLDGGKGDDTLIAGNGNIHLDGGPGNDRCEAGNGNITRINCETGPALPRMAPLGTATAGPKGSTTAPEEEPVADDPAPDTSEPDPTNEPDEAPSDADAPEDLADADDEGARARPDSETPPPATEPTEPETDVPPAAGGTEEPLGPEDTPPPAEGVTG